MVWLLGSIGTPSTSTDSYGNSQTAFSSDQTAVTVGELMTLGGGALFLGGAIATYTNRSTRVRQIYQSETAARLPEWPVTGRHHEIAMPSAMLAPLVNLAF